MLILGKEAESDVRQTYRYYEDLRPGLGADFLLELDRLFERIERHPTLYSWVNPPLRRALCRRFPYAVYFHNRDDDIVVIAVLHQRSLPQTHTH